MFALFNNVEIQVYKHINNKRPRYWQPKLDCEGAAAIFIIKTKIKVEKPKSSYVISSSSSPPISVPPDL